MQKSISSPTYLPFLDWLKQSRASRGLTIRDLAELLGEHPSVIGKIETGQRRLDIFEYVQYCKLLKVEPSEGLSILQVT
jgi:transcriptional regulator with XRE-family HTH domain